MGTHVKGQKLDLLLRHQSFRRFSPKRTIGEVLKQTESQPYKLVVRVFGSWKPEDWYRSEFLKVSDTIWLERIGIPQNADGSYNFPHVLEIVGVLSEEQFQERCVEL